MPSSKYLITRADWELCKINPSKIKVIETVYKAINANKERYRFVTLKTGVPWWLIGAIHYREASLRFDSCLHNGDPLNKVTTHVPRGRGPFKDWEASAVDVMKLQHADQYDFSKIENALNFALNYNGKGYEMRGLRSPYVWGLTNLQTPGKFVADHKFDPTAINKRPGVAAIAKLILQES